MNLTLKKDVSFSRELVFPVRDTDAVKLEWLMMAETPKKIVDCEYKCFLCDAFTPSSAGRVRIFGQSVVDLACLIEWTAGEDLRTHQTAGADLFACNTTCYKRLLKFEKAKKNLETIKSEIYGTYQSINAD